MEDVIEFAFSILWKCDFAVARMLWFLSGTDCVILCRNIHLNVRHSRWEWAMFVVIEEFDAFV